MRHHLFPDDLRIAAQKMAVIETLAEHLQSTYMEQEAEGDKQIISGLLPYEDRVVSQAVLEEVYGDLVALVQEQQQIIRSYRVVKRSPRENLAATAGPEPSNADGVRPATKGAPRAKRPAGSEGAGDPR